MNSRNVLFAFALFGVTCAAEIHCARRLHRKH
jgi:hypothetical protein